MESTTPRPPLGQLIIYALGQFGWALASFSAINLLLYFYMPPEDGQAAVFPPYIFQGAILGIATVIGLINFGGRLFDGVTDPLIANWSDKATSSFGKRRKFMAIAAVPVALFSFLVFYPLTDGVSTLNIIWLAGTIFAFYFFLTLYVVPYTALISELGHHPKDRMLISTLLSVAFALALVVGNGAYAIPELLPVTYSPTEALQATVGIFAAVSLIFLLIPVFFLNENKYCYQKSTTFEVFKSIKSVFQNVSFRYFLWSDLTYWIALTFIQLGVSFYVVSLFGLEKSMGTLFATLGFGISFLLYIPINLLVKKYGKKTILSTAFWSFALTFLLTFLTPYLPIEKMTLFYLIAILSGYPLACFGIIPNVIIADVVYAHEQKTGTQQAGMFYGVRNFMMKMGISLANLIFPSLLLLGKSSDNSMGVQATAMAAVVFCLLGWGFFRKYQEED
jgi:Na+/melibiose symporter-like transporter